MKKRKREWLESKNGAYVIRVEGGANTQNDAKIQVKVLGNLDIIQYAKTILLFMIVYIVVSNVNVQSLLCKLPYFSIPAVEGAVAAPQMSFLGNVGVALVAGVLMATVQASV